MTLSLPRPLTVILFLSLLVACTSTPVSPDCSITEPIWVETPAVSTGQPSPDEGYYFVNEDQSIWAAAWWTNQEELHANERIKLGWFRPAGAELRITGRRLDGQAPALEREPGDIYPARFQPAVLIFPTEGCWEVIGQAEDHELSFVVRIEP